MSVGETPQCANDSHASLPTAWQTTSLIGPAACTGCHYRGQRKTNIYPGKWFSGERLPMQTQELHSGSRRWCSPLPWHLSDLLIPLVHCVLESCDWLPYFGTMPSTKNHSRKQLDWQRFSLGILWLTMTGFPENTSAHRIMQKCHFYGTVSQLMENTCCDITNKGVARRPTRTKCPSSRRYGHCLLCVCSWLLFSCIWSATTFFILSPYLFSLFCVIFPFCFLRVYVVYPLSSLQMTFHIQGQHLIFSYLIVR